MILGVSFMLIGAVLYICGVFRAYLEDTEANLPEIEQIPLDEA